MNKLLAIVVLAGLANCLLAAPQDKPDSEASIVQSGYSNDGAGNFEYQYETENGIKNEAKGYLKEFVDVDGDKVLAQVQKGRFSYILPDNTPIVVE